jgi:7,8-dihydropterin-6-yl-methyl-4-(beta-D-ribofuranosyl)aminobenzene 5'-phosphate synthase
VAILALGQPAGGQAHAVPPQGRAPARITNLYDAFRASAGARLATDWGFAALVEHRGRRILFDTGQRADLFAANVGRLGVDLGRLDAVVISHAHGDHTGGLTHLRARNPRVPIYAPFASPDPRWHQVGSDRELWPGFRLLHAVSTAGETRGLHELSLHVATARGAVVVVGCSHPGIEGIVARARRLGPVHLVTGGFHLFRRPRAFIEGLAARLRQKHQVARIGPAHCSGEPARAAFRARFRQDFVEAGLGAVIPLPPPVPPPPR